MHLRMMEAEAQVITRNLVSDAQVTRYHSAGQFRHAIFENGVCDMEG